MRKLTIERLGGYAGFGGGSHLRSIGELNIDELSPADKQAVDDLFAAPALPAIGNTADGFRYKITKETPDGIVTIEAEEASVPGALKQCVRDEIV